MWRPNPAMDVQLTSQEDLKAASRKLTAMGLSSSPGPSLVKIANPRCDTEVAHRLPIRARVMKHLLDKFIDEYNSFVHLVDDDEKITTLHLHQEHRYGFSEDDAAIHKFVRWVGVENSGFFERFSGCPLRGSEDDKKQGLDRQLTPAPTALRLSLSINFARSHMQPLYDLDVICHDAQDRRLDIDWGRLCYFSQLGSVVQDRTALSTVPHSYPRVVGLTPVNNPVMAVLLHEAFVRFRNSFTLIADVDTPEALFNRTLDLSGNNPNAFHQVHLHLTVIRESGEFNTLVCEYKNERFVNFQGGATKWLTVDAVSRYVQHSLVYRPSDFKFIVQRNELLVSLEMCFRQ
jgi:hypothetical protein